MWKFYLLHLSFPILVRDLFITRAVLLVGTPGRHKPVTSRLSQHRVHTLFPVSAAPPSSYQHWSHRCLPSYEWYGETDLMQHQTSLVVPFLQRGSNFHILTIKTWLWLLVTEFIWRISSCMTTGKQYLALMGSFSLTHAHKDQFLFIYLL